MNRAIQKDRILHLEFLEEYKVDTKKFDDESNKKITTLHRNNTSLIYAINVCCDKTIDNITEVGSDILTADFIALHGMYKPARMMLRSAIENFIKYILIKYNHSEMIDKSLFKTVDNLKKLSFYSSFLGKWNVLLQAYADLCEDVHTVGPRNMVKMTNLKYFPHYNKESLIKYINMSLSCQNAMIYLILQSNLVAYQSAHHRSKDIILSSLSKQESGEVNTI